MLANIANKGFPSTRLQSIMSAPFFILHVCIAEIHQIFPKNKTWFFNLEVNNFNNNFLLLKNLNPTLGFELSTILVSKNDANYRGTETVKLINIRAKWRAWFKEQS